MVLKAKQRPVVLALEAAPRDRTWDCEYDIYTHLQMKNRVLKSENEKFNYFNTLLQEFVVKDPKADPELVQFTNGLSSIIQSQVLHLQDQNRENTAKENGTEEEKEDSVMVDPQYKYFLDHLMPHGKSYVLNISEDDVFVKYENESSSSTHGNIAVFATDNPNHVSDETEAIVSIDTDKHNGRCRARKSKDAKLSAAKSPNDRSKRVASNSKRGRGRSKRLKKHAVPMNVNGEGVSTMKVARFTQTEGQTIEGKQTDSPSGIETKVKVEIEDYDDDDDDDDALDIRMHVQILDLKVDPLQQDNEVNAREFTEFKENLMKELKRPYCEEEHKRLLQDITARKPVQHHKDLRGRIKIYEEDYPGKSLLDHHVDLAEAIDSALDDHPRVLNLLRGFFYWLRNLSHEGAFMPWRVLDGLQQQ